ncbi:MAG: sugar transferase, partial [Thermodesulfobacteriota bacterium]
MNKEYLLKRPLDVSLSSIGILISSPLWLIISILIKINDYGPVFYSQKRVGKGGIPFSTLKFRTMTPDSDRLFGPLQAEEGDKRVTKVGKYLRNSAMDELPQLISIFKGDMSFVGPRALLPSEIEVEGEENIPLELIPGYKDRQSVLPGLTGIAQIYAPRDISRRNKFRYDKIYIKN